jgi:peptidoglycan/xylan/chitin deacetylase (PgdA/CDA1 family)
MHGSGVLPPDPVRSTSTSRHQGEDVDREVGAFVISLDFELHWGVRDVYPVSSGYTPSILGGREAVPRMLDMFVARGIAATWATVGFLMAESREELQAFSPVVRPEYRDARLDPYTEVVGMNESDDPMHFAAGLVRRIAAAPGQEVATHTFSHFYCLEDGARADAFRQDISSALAIGRARGIDIRSIVLPRNQWNPGFEPVLREAGIECYRGVQPGWMYTALPERHRQSPAHRLARLLDSHVPLTSWGGAACAAVNCTSAGPINIPATCFLRPVSNTGSTAKLRLVRIMRGMTEAARAGRCFHIWWHPHNFGVRTEENLAFLRAILDHFTALHSTYGMQSMTMLQAARAATGREREEHR